MLFWQLLSVQLKGLDIKFMFVEIIKFRFVFVELQT